MRILIAPDKFKGSLGAREVAENIAAGLRDVLPEAAIDLVPVADGGEGTAAAICQARGANGLHVTRTTPSDDRFEARYVWLPASRAAVLEMSRGGWRLADSRK